MNTISLGPLAIPLPLLLVFLASLAAQWMYAREVDRQQVEQAQRGERGLFIALIVGVLGARLVYVLTWSSGYLAAPWSVLNIRDGGFDAWGGVLSALAALLWVLWRGYGSRRALATAGGAALVAFSLALFGSQHYLQALHPPLPTLPLQALDGTASAGRNAEVVAGMAGSTVDHQRLGDLVRSVSSRNAGAGGGAANPC